LLTILLLTSLIIIIPKAAKADSIGFNPIAGYSHGPSMAWNYLPLGGLASGGTHHYYVGAFGAFENILSSNPTHTSGVPEVSVTASFPSTPDPSVIGTNNYLSAGMFAQAEDSKDAGVDYNFYSVLALDSSGNLFLSIGEILDKEYQASLGFPTCHQDFGTEWQITNVDRSTPINLTMAWIYSTYWWVYWYVTINGQVYTPLGNTFPVGFDFPHIIHGFYVGCADTGADTDQYFFQFGIMSPSAITNSVWQVQLSNPTYFINGAWNNFPYAFSIQGGKAYTDNTWMWGGYDYPCVAIATGSTSTLRFVYSQKEAHLTLLWPINPYQVLLTIGVPLAPVDGATITLDGTPYTAYRDSPAIMVVSAGIQHTVFAEGWVVVLGNTYFYYVFLSWSDGSHADPRNLVITSDLSLTAGYVGVKGTQPN